MSDTGEIFKLILKRDFIEDINEIEELKAKGVSKSTRDVLNDLIDEITNFLSNIEDKDCTADDIVKLSAHLVNDVDTKLRRVRNGEEIKQYYDDLMNTFVIDGIYLRNRMLEENEISAFYRRINRIYCSDDWLSRSIRITGDELLEMQEKIIEICAKYKIADELDSSAEIYSDFIKVYGNYYDPYILYVIKNILGYELNKPYVSKYMIKVLRKYKEMLKPTSFNYIKEILSIVDRPMDLIGALEGKLYAHVTLKSKEELINFPWVIPIRLEGDSEQVYAIKRSLYILERFNGLLNHYNINYNRLKKLELLATNRLDDKSVLQVILVNIIKDSMDEILKHKDEIIKEEINMHKVGQSISNIREETLDKFTKQQLIDMVKEEADKLGIAYEDKPGGGLIMLDPSMFDE